MAPPMNVPIAPIKEYHNHLFGYKRHNGTNITSIDGKGKNAFKTEYKNKPKSCHKINNVCILIVSPTTNIQTFCLVIHYL